MTAAVSNGVSEGDSVVNGEIRTRTSERQQNRHVESKQEAAKHVNGDHSSKRVKISDQDHAAFASREMDDDVETALEVDHMILDYLLFQAINACLDKTSLGLCLAQVDQFMKLFQSRYPAYRPDTELHFRQLLLQLVTLVTQRYVRCPATPAKGSLLSLREKNQARARTWIGDASRLPTVDHNMSSFDNALPIAANELEENRAHVLKSIDLPAEDDAYRDAFFGTSECVSLLDIFPLFMRISAACHGMFSCPPTETWMRLAAAWILQACLEQYLVFGASGSDALDEAFAWGSKESEEEDQEDEDMPDAAAQPTENKRGEDPFCLDMDHEDIELWTSIKNRALETILSAEKQYWKDVASHLAAVWDKHPLAKTEQEIVGFLKSLAECIPEPVLVQLQRGQLQGLSREETKAFIKDCGVDIAKIFASIGEDR